MEVHGTVVYKTRRLQQNYTKVKHRSKLIYTPSRLSNPQIAHLALYSNMSAIPIRYINATGKTDFEVLVFAKNFSNTTPQSYYAAWQVLRAQTTSEFEYPVDIHIEINYKEQAQKVTGGPFHADLGSTWEITQESKISTAILTEGIA